MEYNGLITEYIINNIISDKLHISPTWNYINLLKNIE